MGQETKESLGPGSYTPQGKEVTCRHCSHDRFHEGWALINARTRTLLDLEWADKGATKLSYVNYWRIE